MCWISFGFILHYIQLRLNLGSMVFIFLPPFLSLIVMLIGINKLKKHNRYLQKCVQPLSGLIIFHISNYLLSFALDLYYQLYWPLLVAWVASLIPFYLVMVNVIKDFQQMSKERGFEFDGNGWLRHCMVIMVLQAVISVVGQILPTIGFACLIVSMIYVIVVGIKLGQIEKRIS